MIVDYRFRWSNSTFDGFAMDDRRYFGLDALRGGMMMLGIVLHAAMPTRAK